MDTFVICLDDAENMFPNLGHLRLIDEIDGTRIIVHTTPTLSTKIVSVDSPMKINYNFDHIVLTNPDKLSREIKENLPDYKQTRLERIGKSSQLIRMHNALMRQTIVPISELSNYFILPQVLVNSSNSNLLDVSTEISQFIVKPELGARGLSQYLLKVKSSVGLSITKIKSSFQKHTLDDRKSDEVIQLVQSDQPDLIQMSSYGEREQGEAIQHVTEYPQCVTPYIPNIAYEFRLITVDGEILFIQKRSRTTDLVYNRASNEDADQSSSLGIDDIFHKTEYGQLMRSLVQYVLKEVTPAMASVDLFFTEDGRCGILEYSTEFYTADLPSHCTNFIFKSFIRNIMKKSRG